MNYIQECCCGDCYHGNCCYGDRYVIVAMITITMVIIAMITHYHHLMVMVTMVIVPTCNEKVTIMSINQPKWKDSSCNSKDINTTANRYINICRDRQHHWDRVWIVTVGQVYPCTPAVQTVMYKIAIVSKNIGNGKANAKSLNRYSSA